MNPAAELAGLAGMSADELGRRMHERIERLYPICRSLTGGGVRQTLHVLQETIPLEIREVPTGTQVFDWTVPREWNIRDAWIKDSSGRRVVDFQRSNLHVLGYSVPVHRKMRLAELRDYLFTLPEQPDLIPYRTSYYQERWGFCLAHNDLIHMSEDEVYDVCIDSSLDDGHLTYGECVVPGASADEILIHTHVCHPSLCNDNLSGICVAAELARLLAAAELRHTVRFLFLPGTIGAITWLAWNQPALPRIRHGLVLSNLGNASELTYKRSRRATATIDRAAAHVLQHWPGSTNRVIDFTPYGYDERQYCSPGLNLPVGALSRSPCGSFREYHTSADDLGFVTPASLADSLLACLTILDVIDSDAICENTCPKGEPQLGRRGLYSSIGGTDPQEFQNALLWVLNFSDGEHSLLAIAELSDRPFRTILEAARALRGVGLLRETTGPPAERGSGQVGLRNGPRPMSAAPL